MLGANTLYYGTELITAVKVKAPDTPLWGRLLALPTNIRLGRKGLLGANTLAYYGTELITAIKLLKYWALEDKTNGKIKSELKVFAD